MSVYSTDYDVFLREISKLETPSIIYNVDQLESSIDEMTSTMGEFSFIKLNFALKACYNRDVLKCLSSKNLGCDVSSRRELELAEQMNFKQITSTSPYYSPDDMNYFVSKNITLDINSLSQLVQYGELFPNTDVGLRLKLQKEEEVKKKKISRFGLCIEDLELFNTIKKYKLNIISLHMHTEMTDEEHFIKKVAFLLESLSVFPNVKTFNLGGGLLHLFLDMDKFVEVLKKTQILLENSTSFTNDMRVIIEPGSAITELSGYLLTEIVNIGRRNNEESSYVEVDTSAWSLSPWGTHQVINLSKFPSKIESKIYIYGNTCFEEDLFFSTNEKEPHLHPIGEFEIGDKLLFSSFGAYTTTNKRDFNLQKKAKEIAFKKGHIY